MKALSEHPPPGELDLLVIGPATRDLLPGGGWRVGGTVLYGALTAARFGLRVGVLTSAPPDVAAALRDALPGVRIAVRSSPHAATFENHYHTTGGRSQYLRQGAVPLRAEDVPAQWRDCEHVWLAPLARDVDPAVLAVFPAAARVAATPQGWLRDWDAQGRVTPGLWSNSAPVLSRVEALIVSEEDLQGAADVRTDKPPSSACWLDDDDQLRAWRAAGPIVVVTHGDRGATLVTSTTAERFPAFAVTLAEATGAGDVFAAALLSAWWSGGDLREALQLANAAASWLVERGGVTGVPTREQALARVTQRALDQPPPKP